MVQGLLKTLGGFIARQAHFLSSSRRAPHALAVVVATGLVAPADGLRAQETPAYQINAEDVLQIRVGHWDVTAGEYRSWDGFSGQYRVGPDGRVSVPIAGSIVAAGGTASDLVFVLSAALQAQVGLATPPAVAVEVMSHGPIFVSGDVRAPGSYPFHPGMVVEQAIALASGQIGAEQADVNMDARLVDLQGERLRMMQRRSATLLEIARIEAELEGEDAISPPESEPMLNNPTQSLAVGEELLDANRRAMVDELQSVADLVVLLKDQIVKLDEEMVLVREQIVRAEEALEAQQRLIARGLSVSRVEDAAATALATLQTREIQLSVERLRATQDLNAAERRLDSVPNSRRIVLLTALDAANARVSDLTTTIEKQSAMMSELLRAGGRLSAEDEKIEIEILRRQRGAAQERVTMPADLTTELQPGDTVIVRRELLDANGVRSQ